MTHHISSRWTLFTALAVALPLLSTSCKSDDPQPVPPPGPGEAIEVRLEKTWEAYYFEPNYNNDPSRPTYSNYFVELAQGNVGTDGFLSYPMTEGEYILDLDLNVPGLSNTPDEPMLPAGTYTPVSRTDTDADIDFTFSLVNTMLIKNIGEAEDGSAKFQYFRFTDGEIKVTTEGNVYTIDATFTCTANVTGDEAEVAEPEKFHCTFTGEVPVINPKEKEVPYNYDSDLDVKGIIATAAKYDEGDQDNYIFRCFSSNQLTSDGMHVNGEGTKLQFNLFTPKGSGIAGDYTIKDGNANWTATPGSRMANMASGSFAETADKILNGRLQAQYSLLKSGTLSIREIGNDEYTVSADCIDSEGYTVKMPYTGTINTGSLIIPTTTLTSDITFQPVGVSQIITFGDYFNRGVTNVWVSLANETEVITLDMFLPGNDIMNLPEGKYTVSDSMESFSILPGTIEDSAISPSFFLRYDASGSAILNYATINSGTVEISKSGNLYTFKFEFFDNHSLDMQTPAYHKISGQVTCEIPEFTHYSQVISAPRRFNGLTPAFAGNRQGVSLR